MAKTDNAREQSINQFLDLKSAQEDMLYEHFFSQLPKAWCDQPEPWHKKVRATVHFDEPVYAMLKSFGGRWQEELRRVLRAYYQVQKHNLVPRYKSKLDEAMMNERFRNAFTLFMAEQDKLDETEEGYLK